MKRILSRIQKWQIVKENKLTKSIALNLEISVYQKIPSHDWKDKLGDSATHITA